ncbi:MAG TPA: MurR/RpiR family transcriptional regulator [Candidatus Acidoferrales bacterium]|jgi:RpiR family carbohydrate utilization transcriptional regulator|nr:MurR/RpiR family transcriptional regulator [Candidatus Acidoferrales bacterium]
MAHSIDRPVNLNNSLAAMKAKPQSAVPHLAERIDQLSIKRQEIIRPILEHPREYVLLSVRALAKRLGTDPATIVRIVRGLGFESYRDFQHHLHELSLAFATSLDTMRAAGHDGGMPGYIREALEQDLKNLQGLKNSLDERRLVALAKRIYAARKIILIAGDLAAYLADYFEYQTSVVGLPVFSATSYGRIAHLARTATKQDLVIAISFRRGLRQTVEGAQLARAKGAYCVGIADTFLSPLARICDEIFLASVESTSFAASFTAPVALLNAIVVTCAQYRRAETMVVVKELAEEQRKGFRWYTA